ncbi:MAG: UDP-2,3-diacylglucosamine diphosphatase [Symbiopectobacterium sp.]|uniref:UDP-2,3-diacylglucosamine diphosphatase n=1 Tax=Symbiopectobacterium sp. TaxID=2952789 RepID=UPI0039EA882E
MATLFIADLHLNVHEPAITAGFLRFLERDAQQADALYILGDLFDAWIGDDDPQPLHTTVAEALYQLQQCGVPCYFIHGNRDFLLGKHFAKRAGITLLPTEQVIEHYGRRILIMHGDTLCIDDEAYQKYRRRVHNPVIQWLFLRLPLRLRLKMAAKMRAASQLANQNKSQQIMDVNQQAVLACLHAHNINTLIHGHTHRPAIHTVVTEHGEAQRAVLGAWHEQGWMIKVTADDTALISFPF